MSGDGAAKWRDEWWMHGCVGEWISSTCADREGSRMQVLTHLHDGLFFVPHHRAHAEPYRGAAVASGGERECVGVQTAWWGW